MGRSTTPGFISPFVLLSGCANMFGGVDVHRITPTMIAIAQPANVRSAYTNGTNVCPEPPPDAALQAVANAAAKITSKAGAAVDVSGSLTTSVVQLAGRTQTVLIARDAFTANCILKMNGYIDSGDAEGNFKQTLLVIQTIANADKTAAEADATKAKTDQVKVALAASGSTDPVVKAAIANLTSTVDSNVDTIMKALSTGNGVLVPSLVKKFFGQGDVQTMLSSNVADMLGAQTDAGVLTGLLNGVWYQYSEALAALAKNFKG